jgi:hypothetical protein
MTTFTTAERQVEEDFSESPRRYWLGATPPVIVVHLVTLVAGLAILLRENRHLWFFGDDWEFLVKRGLHHPTLSVWQPHNEHWSTLPILLYRLLFTLFGLHYFPFILLAIVAHLVLAHLLWRTCLREAVDAWVATTFAALFVVLGSGAENLTWDFQITFIGSLVFGYLALEVARRPPSLGVDLAVSLLLLGSLMCSTVGDAMVVAVGLFLIVERGWRSGLRALVLPVGCYLLWYGLVGHRSVTSDQVGLTTLLNAPGFIWNGVAAALGNTFGLSSAGAALLIGLLAWTISAFPRLYRSHPAVLGLGFGAGVFYLLVALGRSGSGGSADASRYIYLAMALLIPLMATLISSVRRPAFELRVPVFAVLLVVIVANLGFLRNFAASRVTIVQPQQEQIVTTASLLAQGLPSLVQTPIAYSPDLTTTAMRDLVRSDRLSVVPVSATQRLEDEVAMDVVAGPNRLVEGSLSIVGTHDVTVTVAANGCSVVHATGPNPSLVVTTPHAGGFLSISGAPNAQIGTALVEGSQVVAGPRVTLDGSGRSGLNSEVRDGHLVLEPAPGSRTVTC